MYIQLLERQQLGFKRRFLKYSEIQGEREKMANYRNFSQVCISLYTPLHTNGKEINRTKRNNEGKHSSFNNVLTWRMEVFYLVDPDFATGSFKYTP